MAGIDPKQQYSFYSGCSVTPGEGADWLVNGFDTTYSINSKMTDGKYESSVPASSAADPYDAAKAVKKQGEVCALAQEDAGTGHILIAGTVFLSDFEVKADADNNWDLPYANRTIAENLLDMVKVDIPTTSIADVRKNGRTGDVYEVEGTVTAGSEQPNAFTDTVYLQDATGGINIYPVANGSGIRVGQKLRVVGHVDEYQGDKELKIGSGVEGYEVIDTSVKPAAPAPLSVADALNYSANGGRLVQVTGTVSGVKSMGGVIQEFTLSSGGSGIRILINGYINPDINLSGVVKEGATVSAIGLVYMDPDGVCLRVRDRNEITSAASRNDDSHKSDNTPAKTAPGAATVTTGQENGRTVQTISTRPAGEPVVLGNRSSVTVTVPDDAAAAVMNATPQSPAEVRVAPPAGDLLAQLNNPAVQSVSLNIQMPAAVANNTNSSATVVIQLPREVLLSARDARKDIAFSVTDAQSGKELYTWSFSGADVSRSAVPVSAINLVVSVQPARGNSVPAAVRNASGSGSGVVIGFANNGLLPAPARVRVYVGNQPGVRPNSNMYFYYCNPVSGLLESMQQNACIVDADGYATVTIPHCSDYVLLPEKAKNAYPVTSDTTFPFGVPVGKSYTFAMMSEDREEPKFTVGNSGAFRVAVVRKNGKYLVTVQAVGSAGKTTALYSTLPGHKPVVMCYITTVK